MPLVIYRSGGALRADRPKWDWACVGIGVVAADTVEVGRPHRARRGCRRLAAAALALALAASGLAALFLIVLGELSALPDSKVLSGYYLRDNAGGTRSN